MKKLIWISALVPTQGADTYGGVRIGTHDSEEDALDDLRDWLNDQGGEDVPDAANIAEALDESPQVAYWNVESREIEVVPPAILDPTEDGHNGH